MKTEVCRRQTSVYLVEALFAFAGGGQNEVVRMVQNLNVDLGGRGSVLAVERPRHAAAEKVDPRHPAAHQERVEDPVVPEDLPEPQRPGVPVVSLP